MSNSKISALTSASTPLAGTETLPIVQGGVTVKATVANITGAGAYAGSFTTLGATGDATLGDATTDVVTVNGYMGVGTAPLAPIGVYNASTALTTASQRGFQSSPVGTSAATTRVVGFWASPGTAATAYTSTTVTCFYAASVNKGAGSTITNANGLYIEDLTTGTNNYGITSLISSGTNKWNIYASGTANNYMAGSLGIGTTGVTGYSLHIGKTITGATSSFAASSDGTVQTDVTTLATSYQSNVGTVASSFTLANLRHFTADQATFGATSVVTNQVGYWAGTSLSGATNNYGFYGNMSSAASRWNLYMGGTADNYLAGNLLLGTTTQPTTSNNIVIAGLNATSAAAPTIASAATIAPTKQITFISGTAAIATITAPNPISVGGGQITLIPTGAFTTTVAGNIALASVAVANKALIMTYDTTTAKWYPSY